MTTNAATRVLCLLLIAFALAGCGKEEVVTVPNRPVFDTAVEKYLSRNSMDLAIVEYRGFELAASGVEASAVISLRHADESYGNLQVRFAFEFEKTDDRWRVTAHRKAK